ncbi:hypothetical protein GCM10007938_23240 [Vibrio zhanjiangensis]|uniref:Cytolytic delta-endotoxin n=1 Tax=Vibrio zhanjiangensis TaxID=1046128 RepID=A0ABQ6F1A5_9VIBR|nr:hypothetical protein [Vibrio zhanjiangensis]GLT18545.1 hypothetical protein GCM10007938_23240 [Vibrio zhanjiangensis]
MYITRDVNVTPVNSPVVLGDSIFKKTGLATNARVLATEDQQSLKFKTLFSLEPQYISQAIAATRVFQQALNSSLEFNIAKAEQLAQENNIQVERTIQPVISSDSPQGVISKLDVQLDEVVGGTFPDNLKAKIMDIVSDGFVNLYRNESSAWIFWSSESAHKSSYYYTMLLAIQENDVLVFVPLGFYIQASISKEKILFITVSSSTYYSVALNGLKGTQPLGYSSETP